MPGNDILVKQFVFVFVSFTTALNITLHGHIAWGAMKMTIFKYGNGMVGILKEMHTDLLCMLYNTN